MQRLPHQPEEADPEVGRAAPDGVAARRRRLRLLGGAFGLVVLVVAAVAAFGAFKRDPTAGGSRTTVGDTAIRGVEETAALLRGIPQQGTVLGRADAPATILVVSDLKCPSCQAHALTVQPEVVDRLVRTGRANLRMVLVDFRDPARGTTDGARLRRAAYAFAAEDRFWGFVQTAFWNQGRTEDEWATPSFLRAVAAVAPGVAPARVQDRETPAVRAAVAEADREAKDLGTDATPSVYVVRRGATTGGRVSAIGDVDAITDAVERAGDRSR